MDDVGIVDAPEPDENEVAILRRAVETIKRGLGVGRSAYGMARRTIESMGYQVVAQSVRAGRFEKFLVQFQNGSRAWFDWGGPFIPDGIYTEDSE